MAIQPRSIDGRDPPTSRRLAVTSAADARATTIQ
jgi:hypothetical protein